MNNKTYTQGTSCVIVELKMESTLCIFADDTRVGLPISGASDNCLLQQDLCRIYDWAKESNMEFNSEKFEMLCYQAHPKQPRPPQTLVSDIGTPIEEKDHQRDLGVKSLILCHIDYCSQLWSPYKTGEIQAIESLQKAFISKIASMHEFNYWQQLKMLKLYSLERRRERYSIIYLYMVHTGISGTQSLIYSNRGEMASLPRKRMQDSNTGELSSSHHHTVCPIVTQCIPPLHSPSHSLSHFHSVRTTVCAIVT